MATFHNSKKLGKHLKKALTALQAETLITTQSRLSSTRVSPVDTGRFRSSWFAAESSPSDEVAPEGTNKINRDAEDLKLKMDINKEYHLTNNLPYAEEVALNGHVTSKPSDWFTSFVSTTTPKIAAEAARQIKKEFDL